MCIMQAHDRTSFILHLLSIIHASSHGNAELHSRSDHIYLVRLTSNLNFLLFPHFFHSTIWKSA